MITFAEVVFRPEGLIAWIVIGLIAGWLAGRVMNGSGYGILGDIVIGIIGAVIGGALFGYLVTTDYGLLGSIVVAFIGACILIAVVRAIAPGRTRL